MSTTVTYGEIVLHNVQTRRWQQTVQYDDTGTDVIGSTFSLAFDGLIHAQRIPLQESVTYVSPGGGQPATATAAYVSIRELLSRPRQTLRVLIGQEVALEATSTTGNFGLRPSTDIDNGPKPRRVEITSVVGSSAFRVRFEVDVTIGSCPPSNASMVVANRWSVAETMDSNFATTRSIEGSLRIAASRQVFEDFPVGHQFRGLVFPALETGFRRERIDFTSEADGLTCRYAIIDKQVDSAAPWPATDMQVQHTEGTSDGIKYGSSVQVQLKGPPYVDKRLLVERAIAIADSRLLFFISQGSTAYQVMTRCEIVDYIGPEAMITLNIHTLHQTDSPKALLGFLRTNVIGRPLTIEPAQAQGDEIPDTEYNRFVSPLPQLYGYSPEGERRPSVLVMLHAFLKDTACTSDEYRNVNAALRLGTDVESPHKGKKERDDESPEIREGDEGAIQEADYDRYRDAGRSSIYSISKISSQYSTDDMKVAMPFSKIAPARQINSPTNVVFDLSEPQTLRRIDIDSERFGELPKIPEPFSVITDGTLVATRLKKEETIYPPVLTADGRYEVFRIEATYWYSLNRPPRNDEQLRIGTHHFAEGLTNSVRPNEFYDSQLA